MANLPSVSARLARQPKEIKEAKEEIELIRRDAHSGSSAADLDKLVGLSSDEVKAAIFRGETINHPKNWRAYARLGSVQAKLSRYTEAIINLNEAARLGSTDPMTYYALGQCYVLTSHKDSAMVAYNKLKTLDDTMAEKLKRRIEQ